MKTAEAVLGNLAGLLWGNWMLFVLLGLGVFYTIATGCIQFRSIPWIIKEFCKKKIEQNHPGTIREPCPPSRLFIWQSQAVWEAGISWGLPLH